MSSKRPIRSWLAPALVISALAVFFVIGCVTGRGQPHMQAALDQLQGAKTELQVALSDKGGHRVRAITLVDEAIGEVEAGMAYAASR